MALLVIHILAGRDVEVLLKHAGEMLGIFKAEKFCGLVDGCAADEQVTGALHYETVDGTHGCVACQFFYQVAKIVGRQEQLLCAIANGG